MENPFNRNMNRMSSEDSEYYSDDMESDSDNTEADSDDKDNGDSYFVSSNSESEKQYSRRWMFFDDVTLKNEHLERSAAILQELCEDELHFFAEDELCVQDISIEVDGIGSLSFPLKGDCIEKLMSISTKARFGKGEETVLNEDVRDTHEIPGKKLNVKINKESFTRMLDKMGSEMGFSENCVLETELHNMLIYSRGQFFDLHQDFDKAENMIGTLVISLPLPHIGGDLVIHRGTKSHTFSSENIAYKDLKCIAFYAYCKHKIEKVKEGFRIVLTYKLTLKTKENKSISFVNEKLKYAIQNYFADSKTNTQKYVYFLHHSYNEHSLKWNILKGDDCIKSKALLAVGKSLSLTPHLALVKVIPKHNDDNRRTSSEFCKTSYLLSHWINSNNEMQLFKHYSVRENKICWNKDTVASFKPSEKDFSCCTGNASFDVCYSYQRAAIVLWQSSSDVVMKLILNPEGAFKDLQATMESPGKENEVKEIVKAFGKELYRNCKNKKDDFENRSQIALYINDRKLALTILSRFKWSILGCDISESMAKLESQYGSAWCIALLNEWREDQVKHYYRYCTDQETILKKLNNFVETYVNFGGTSKVVEIIMGEQFRNISSKTLWGQYNIEKFERDVVDILYEFIISCTVIENTEWIDKVMQFLVYSSPIPLNTYLTDLYLKLKTVLPANYLINCYPLKMYLICSISAELQSEKKSPGNCNWSVKKQLKCFCKNCQVVNSFLRSNTEMKKEWKPSKNDRCHLRVELKKVNLPVTLCVEANRGPKKVTLVKNEGVQVKSKRIGELQLILKKLQS